jgi:hypothetical protein
VLDGSGDGMIQVLVKNTNNGKSFIDMVVGQAGQNLIGSSVYDNGLALNESFVTYNGNGAVTANSIANKSIITSGPTAGEGGFTLHSEWLRGSFQTDTNSFTLANRCSDATNPVCGVDQGNANGTATRMDAITDQVINGIQAFHYTGMSEENGNPGATGLANTIVADIAIDQGTSAATRVAGLADQQAMGVFAYRSTGGTLDTTIDYTPTPTTITLGTNSLTVDATNGVRAVYLGQQMFGFNGSQTDTYASDDRTKRDFGFVRYTTSNGAPSTGFGYWAGVNGTDPSLDPVNNPQLGVGNTLQSIAMSSQVGTSSILTGATAQNNTVRETDYTSTAPQGNNVNDFTTAGSGGEFQNSAALVAQWSTLFSTVQTGSGNITTAPTNVDNNF